MTRLHDGRVRCQCGQGIAGEYHAYHRRPVGRWHRHRWTYKGPFDAGSRYYRRCACSRVEHTGA